MPPGRSALVRFLFSLSLLASLAAARAQPGAALRLGIMPFNSPLALLRTHQPLREHLQARLGTPVEIQTSPDFARYLDEVLAGRYDLAILAPHLAVLALQDARWRPLFRYRSLLEPVLVVRRDSDIRQAAQVRGRSVAVPSRLALVTIMGLQRFRLDGVGYPGGLSLAERTTHGAAIAAVAVGDADAALTTEHSLRQVPADISARLRSIPLGVAAPHLVTIANPALGEARIEAIRAALADFPASEGGRRFFAEIGYGGYEPFSREDTKGLLPYAQIVRQLLGERGRP